MKKAKPNFLHIPTVEKAIGLKVDKWHGNCYAIACTMLRAKLLQGRAVYGHYTGPVAATGFWADCRNMPFIRHGWIVDKNGIIIDPTRWSFEDAAPYIAVGANPQEYDEGGNDFHDAFLSRPVPKITAESKKLELKIKDASVRKELSKLLGDPEFFTTEHMLWVANLHPKKLGIWAPEIYRILVENDMEVFIPMDNRLLILGKV